jgi:Flp pilus assembly protein TadB
VNLLQVPAGYTINEQLTVVIAIVVCISLLLLVGKYIWDRLEKSSISDRDWREAQNKTRDENISRLQSEWRQTVKEMNDSNQASLRDLAQSVQGVGVMLRDHDVQAKEIKTIVNEIHANTKPGNGKPAGRM